VNGNRTPWRWTIAPVFYFCALVCGFVFIGAVGWFFASKIRDMLVGTPDQMLGGIAVLGVLGFFVFAWAGIMVERVLDSRAKPEETS
jgi:hypothetical protein